MPPSDPPDPPPKPRKLRNRILIGLSVLVVMLAGYTAWANLHVYTLTASIDIDAPPDKVWEVLVDRESYPDWNPFLVSSKGGLKEGGTITNLMRSADGSETEFTPTVLVVEPGKELRWIGKLSPGLLFDGEHSFRLIKRGSGTRLIQSEDFTGALVPPMRSWLDGDTLPQFKAMNKALKKRTEAGG